ncbi:MAG TPA: hypothetical protein VI997_04710, partial [Candidatus Thermoplasmatota archaeon]|nr:hypothetical protein [Candidatus Thermoplasmatota archaeon]
MDAAPLAWVAVGVLGALLGFVPGLHPNLAAAFALAAPGLAPAWGPVLLALAAGHVCGALAAGHLHGSSDPDASALPAGGREAAELAALGAFFGLVAALPLAALARYALAAP